VVKTYARGQEDRHDHSDARRYRSLPLGQCSQQGGKQEGCFGGEARVLFVSPPISYNAKTGEGQGCHGQQDLAAQQEADTAQQSRHRERTNARGRTRWPFPFPAFAFRSDQKANRQSAGQSKYLPIGNQHLPDTIAVSEVVWTG
jgi:hypothetical protein